MTTQQQKSIATGNETPVLQQQIRDVLGAKSEQYITASRINMMLAITQNSVDDTVVMALGYIVQTLSLLAQSNPADVFVYQGDLQNYRQRLQCFTPSKPLQKQVDSGAQNTRGLEVV
jgi:hypothetical protein